MKAGEAKKLKIGDKVWIDYTPSPGHGDPIHRLGKVVLAPPRLSRTHKNICGKEYVWIHVNHGTHASVFPSWCLSKLNK